jgi:hypothetical protein
MIEQSQAPFPGSEEIDGAAEHIIPPEQPPMDDAAGGPQGDAVEQPADEVEPSEEEAVAQMGNLS